MANGQKIKKTMIKQGIPEAIISQFDFPDTRGNYAPTLPLMAQMDELLTREQCLAVMQEQGCCLTGEPCKTYRTFGKEHAGETIAERIPALQHVDSPHKYNCRLNADGTLSVWWSEWWGEGNKIPCPCPVTKDAPSGGVSKTHCACCGGHARRHLQNGLGVKLNLTEVVSTSSSSNGEQRCEFLYDIIAKS